MKVIVTGGCGFIGSNFINYLLMDPNEDIEIINIDLRTYAGRGNNLDHMELKNNEKYKFYEVDISNKELILEIFKNELPDIVFNFAAESHVDNSIIKPDEFLKTNVIGTLNLLEASKKYPVKKFIQISTDEVYGSATQESFDEKCKLSPSSPYSSSKASSELLALSYYKTHGIPLIVTRSVNNYGPYQYPEKLIPLFITNLIERKKIPLMWSEDNPGSNIRDWIHVIDNCRAIWFLSQNGKIGEIYNIPGMNEKSNLEITKKILDKFNLDDTWIEKIPHRKGHDYKYSVSGSKLTKLGFQYKYDNFDKHFNEVIDWYKENKDWWDKIKNKTVVFGNGYLGNRISKEFGFILTNTNPLEINKLKKFLDLERPSIIINSIGKTGYPNIDWCENNKDETLYSNVTVPLILAQECYKRGIYFIHLSSGCIYEGDNDNKGFSEEDIPNFDDSFYSKSKIIAENILKNFPSLILRIRMPIDNIDHERNLINKLKNYNSVIDIPNSMTYVPDFLKVLGILLSKKAIGVYNVVNPGSISALDIVSAYKENINRAHNFEVMSLEELNRITSARRSNCI